MGCVFWCDLWLPFKCWFLSWLDDDEEDCSTVANNDFDASEFLEEMETKGFITFWCLGRLRDFLLMLFILFDCVCVKGEEMKGNPSAKSTWTISRINSPHNRCKFVWWNDVDAFLLLDRFITLDLLASRRCGWNRGWESGSFLEVMVWWQQPNLSNKTLSAWVGALII